MKALITGASSGIGRDISRELAKRGYDLILVARNIDKLNEVKSSIQNVNVEIIQMDLSIYENCKKLYTQVEKEEIDILINTNIMAVHALTKLFLQNMKKRDKGYILNVASIAGFMPGPLMAAYYASKSYVVRLSESIREELRKDKSNVKIGILCPGPVDTNFNNVANVKFNAKSLTSEYVAEYTVNKMLKNKFYIVPGVKIKALRIITKIVPDNIISKFVYKTQKRKK